MPNGGEMGKVCPSVRCVGQRPRCVARRHCHGICGDIHCAGFRCPKYNLLLGMISEALKCEFPDWAPFPVITHSLL